MACTCIPMLWTQYSQRLIRINLLVSSVRIKCLTSWSTIYQKFIGFWTWPTCLQIPYTFVRGASDYTHLPLMMDPDGTFSEIDTVPQVDFINGYSWAIASYSAVVLDLFTARWAFLCLGKGLLWCKSKWKTWLVGEASSQLSTQQYLSSVLAGSCSCLPMYLEIGASK